MRFHIYYTLTTPNLHDDISIKKVLVKILINIIQSVFFAASPFLLLYNLDVISLTLKMASSTVSLHAQLR